MNEIWKDIPDYEGVYQASTLGRIRSLDRVVEVRYMDGKVRQQRRKGKILRAYMGPYKFWTVTLYRQSESIELFVHRLVAITFLENPKNFTQVTFKDGDINNITIENLKWGRTANE